MGDVAWRHSAPGGSSRKAVDDSSRRVPMLPGNLCQPGNICLLSSFCPMHFVRRTVLTFVTLVYMTHPAAGADLKQTQTRPYSYCVASMLASLQRHSRPLAGPIR